MVDPFWDVLLFVCFTVSSSSFSAPPQEHSNRAETVRRWFHSAGRQCRTRPPTVGRLSPALKWTRGLQCLQNELIERRNEVFFRFKKKKKIFYLVFPDKIDLGFLNNKQSYTDLQTGGKQKWWTIDPCCLLNSSARFELPELKGNFIDKREGLCLPWK